MKWTVSKFMNGGTGILTIRVKTDDVNNKTICKLAGYQGNSFEQQANLIAAAPELLAAVKSMLLYIETYGNDVTKNFAGTNGENVNFYKQLVAKAEAQ